MTPLPRSRHRVGLPRRCAYREALNTDAAVYGGSGVGNMGRVLVEDVACHGHAQSALLELPPLGVLWLVPEEDADPPPLPLVGHLATPTSPGPSRR